MTAQKKAIIIGGGIGGLCADLALRQVGHTIEIYERTPEIQPVGAGLSIWKNGLLALQSLGLDHAFLQSGAANWASRPAKTAVSRLSPQHPRQADARPPASEATIIAAGF